MDSNFQLLNIVYEPVYKYMQSFLKVLTLQEGYEYKWGFYNNHFIKKGEVWETEYYPIPVITIHDICDIGFDIDRTFVECKIKREKALEFHWELLLDYRFEVYGVEEYLNDFYNESLSMESISLKIMESIEQEVGITFHFRYLEDKSSLLELVKRLQEWI